MTIAASTFIPVFISLPSKVELSELSNTIGSHGMTLLVLQPDRCDGTPRVVSYSTGFLKKIGIYTEVRQPSHFFNN
jgi:hypothetical protein